MVIDELWFCFRTLLSFSSNLRSVGLFLREQPMCPILKQSFYQCSIVCMKLPLKLPQYQTAKMPSFLPFPDLMNTPTCQYYTKKTLQMYIASFKLNPLAQIPYNNKPLRPATCASIHNHFYSWLCSQKQISLNITRHEVVRIIHTPPVNMECKTFATFSPKTLNTSISDQMPIPVSWKIKHQNQRTTHTTSSFHAKVVMKP